MFFNDYPYRKGRRGTQVAVASASPRDLKPLDFMSIGELYASPGSELVFDTETYPNLFFAGFKNIKTGKVISFEISPDCPQLEIDSLLWALHANCVIGFMSERYDMVLLAAAVAGVSIPVLKEISDKIIIQEMRPDAIFREYRIKPLTKINHIDIIEVAPLEASLKMYGGRLHCKRMQDLPYDPHKQLTRDEGVYVRHYCVNDLDNTQLLYEDLRPEIKLREELSNQYGVDLRSKSDAQLAETVIVSEIQKITGRRPRSPEYSDAYTCRYDVPEFISYQTEQLQRMLEIVGSVTYHFNAAGKPIVPQEIDDLKLSIGSGVYTIGNGGLHSTEKCSAHFADDETEILDRDVASFYPRIILNNKLCPEHLGENFLTVYNSLVEKRLTAKAAGKKDKAQKAIADSLKIVINGSFGKLGSPYSVLYAPKLMLQVTITGQLSLLMLIELIELAGIHVVSGNTDGIVIKCPKSRRSDLEAIIKYWEQTTGFETEETKYTAIYSRDVNNYIALKEKGDEKAKFLDERLGCKTKGSYSERGSALNSVLSKNPEHLICTDAVLWLLTNGTPIKETVESCTDFRRFVVVRQVKGGAHKSGVYLGKTVRWYYAKGETGTINYVNGGNKVPKSEGAKPAMDLPLELPDDINYDWYINKAMEILDEIGYNPKPKQDRLFF